MVDIVTRVNNVVNGFVWGPFGLALLFCTGLWLSVRTGFFPVPADGLLAQAYHRCYFYQ